MAETVWSESGTPAVAPERGQLLTALRRPGQASASIVRPLIECLERLQPADLERQSGQLAGVWELRWSSSALPYLLVGACLVYLQVLDPAHGRALNLLRLKGPLGSWGAVAVRAAIEVVGRQRVQVLFDRGGWIGPRIAGAQLDLLRSVRQSFPAWLDITVLDDELRICRGNAGTLFALVRRSDDLSAVPWPA
jgi:hypothetical protein